MKYSAEQLADANIHLFLEHYNITNDQGQKLDFKEHPFMWDVYKDWSPKIVGKKAAQITWSTCFNIKCLYAAKMFGMDFIYSLPTANEVEDFVSGKTNRLIDQNPIFQRWTQDKDSIKQKSIGKNKIYYRGTWVDRAAIATPADGYIADEVDRSDQEIVEMFSSRLQHSKFAWEWRFSNPSVPENGVDKWWQESDQKEWFIQCTGCNREQILMMTHIQNNMFVCEKCGKELDRHKGRWIKRFQGREISGYHTSLLMAPWVAPTRILQLKKEKSEQYFENFVMGEPYVGSGNYLPRHILFGNLNPRDNPQDAPPIIGVDTGKKIHYVVGNKYGLFFNGDSVDYKPIRDILLHDPRAIAVIDQGGDITAPRSLQEEFQGRVYLCSFVQSQDVAPRWKEESGMVNTDRNKAIQLVVDEFGERRIPLFGPKDDWSEYADMWGHLYRELEEDDRGRRKYIWKRNGDDHLALATVYWRIGMDKISGGDAEIIMPGSNLFRDTGFDTDGTFTRTGLKRL